MTNMHRCGEIFVGFSKRTLLFVIIFGFALSSAAFAHVKWFAPYDVPGQPVGLKDVFSSAFWLLATGSCFALWAICHAEKTAIGAPAHRPFDRFSGAVSLHLDQLFRATPAGFFFALSMLVTIILSPDLPPAIPDIPSL